MYSNEWGRDNYDNYDDLKLKKHKHFIALNQYIRVQILNSIFHLEM